MEPPSWSVRFNRLRQLFWLSFLLTVVYLIWVRNFISPLSPDDIVQFEISKTVSKAQAMIESWKISGKYQQAVRSTTLSYVFILLYTVAIALGCRFVSACTRNEIMIKGGMGFSVLIFAATICDVIENITLSQTLNGHMSSWNVLFVYDLARVKFSIVIVCLLFILACFLYWGVDRLTGERK